MIEAYITVTYDFLRGMGRLLGAQVAGNTLELAAAEIAMAKVSGADVRTLLADTPAADLLSLGVQELDSFRYVRKTSSLVYATTLLDSFLTDTTTFLSLRHPSSMGRQQPLVLADVLASASRDELITTLALKKSREVSYMTFRDRVAHLEKTFGLRLDVDSATWEEIQHYSGIRNVVVHSQGAHRLSFDAAHGVVVARTTCLDHPQSIDSDTFHKANRAYVSLAGEVFRVVANQVEKAKPTDIQEALDKFVGLIKSTYPYNAPRHCSDPNEVEAARREVDNVTPLPPIGARARELARADFYRYLTERSDRLPAMPEDNEAPGNGP